MTVALPFSHPAAVGSGATVAEIVGAVLSMLSVTLAAAVLPAVSVAVPLTTWPAPSVVTTRGAGHEAIPDRSSAQTNVTVVLPFSHPVAVGSGAMVAEIVGAVLSMLSVTLAAAVLPALSTAVPVTTWPCPSVLTSREAGHVATPDPESLHAKLTWTSVRFQPAALAAGDALAVMVGGVVSPAPEIRTDRWLPGLLRNSMRRLLPVGRSVTVRSMTAFQS